MQKNQEEKKRRTDLERRIGEWDLPAHTRMLQCYFKMTQNEVELSSKLRVSSA